MANRYTAVLLAADRRDPADPLAAHAQGRNKCLIDLGGRPMIAWVLDTLLAAPEIDAILISSEDGGLLDSMPEFAPARASGRVRFAPAGANLYLSVAAALRLGDEHNFPAIITTADNPLLTPAMLTHFCTETESSGVSAAISVTRAEVLRAEYPDGQRRFYAFRDGEFSNCNLFAILTEQALGAAEMFKGGGQFRKKAARILRAFGPLSFVLYKLKLLTLEGVAQRLSRLFGARIGFVVMPFAEACIDVDNERTLRVARGILAAREARRRASARSVPEGAQRRS